ncbi:MAG TPA: ABC transporter substrate-binding protein [Acidimicrobiales bacterium]|nr:ABC transporter substrate-binding protein [Acidimicrobiales bacterium]
MTGSRTGHGSDAVFGRIDRRKFLAGGVAAGAATVLSACSSGTTSPTSSATVQSSATAGVGTGTPKKGGTLVVGVDSEIDGFLPSQNHWDNTGYTYAYAVLEALTAVTIDGSWRPYLAESMTANPDHTQWTLTMRPGITFHDGSQLDADVVVANLEQVLASALTKQALQPITDVKSTGPLTLTIDTNEPFITLPYFLASQVGFIVAKSQLDSQNTQRPIGTGPFVYSQWVPNDHFTVTKNQRYWQSGQPYLDSITFHPIFADESREAALRTGQLDIMASRDPHVIKDLAHDPSFSQINTLSGRVGEPDIDFILLNTEADPLSDLTVRQALARSIDAPTLNKLFGAGITPAATGLFYQGSPYYSNNGYPTYDPGEAKSLIEEAKPRHGGQIAFMLQTIPDPRLIDTTQAIQQMWNQVGCDVSIGTIQQVELIANSATGHFQALTFELFGVSDPDLNYQWWSSTTAAPIGSIALNFARNRDPVIDAALEQGRTSSDMATRVAAYQTIDRQLAKDLPYLYLGVAPWSLTAATNVENYNNWILPDGSREQGFNAGAFNPSPIWLVET